jgi:diguanylate cyclase (GGDEF)-like protein
VQKCLDAIRPYDGVARVGGEEFMVLLPKAALSVARSIAERVRGAVATEEFYTGTGRAVAVTVSVGISEFGRDGDTIDTLLRVADERLYQAKHDGRNRVVAG